jgi:hypothetical protein
MHLARCETIDQTLNSSVSEYLYTMVVAMLSPVYREALPEDITIELLEILTILVKTIIRRRFRLWEGLVVYLRVFAEELPFGWSTSFMKTLVE